MERLTVLILIGQILGALTSVRAVMEHRSVGGAIAWAVSLNLMPWIAVPSYWLVGHTRFEGYVTRRRRAVAGTRDQAQALYERLFQARSTDPAVLALGSPIERLARLPFTSGNRARLLIDGAETFDAIFYAIACAKHYVLVQTYILSDDALGARLRTALAERARAGVKCYVLYDEIGSLGLASDYVIPLAADGVQVCAFPANRGPRHRFQINFRNHRKVVVVDGTTAFLGGHNFLEAHLVKPPTKGAWRDTHVRIDGPAVACVQLAFLEDWHFSARSDPQLIWSIDPAAPPSEQCATEALDGRTVEPVSALVLPSGPSDDFETAGLCFAHLITHARKRVWIATPYFVPDESVVSALQLAALRGVDIRILVPDRSDIRLTQLTCWSFLEDFRELDIRFFRYMPAFSHQKVMLVDDEYATIGTANFDNRSFRLNFEITALIVDRAFASQVAAMLDRDLQCSERFTVGDFDRKPFWFRLAVRIARLFSPIQ